MKSKNLRVAIIGAGPAGVAAGIRLQQQGVSDIVLFEKNSDVGGTWNVNRYPGLTCDVPAHLYRFSFAPNPDWSHRYASRAEILQYIKRMADRFNIPEKVRFNHEVTAAHYRDGRWQIETNHGDAGLFDAVVTAVGVLHHPVYPNIPGLDTFGGLLVHPSEWDETLDLRGKRVGIIGTGSTAVQIVSAVVDQVKGITLFQRTPQWILPEPNPEIPEGLRKRYRDDPDYLEEKYQDLFARFMNGFGGAVTNPASQAYAQISQLCRDNLQNVKSDELRAKLTPDYEVGCKRLVVSSNFYEAIQKPNARLVTEAIERIEERGVRTADGELHEFDMLVTATGFDPYKFFGSMQITGLNGMALDEAWREVPRNYHSVCVPGFPNWFMIGGPTTPIGNFPYFKTVEHQLGYILQLIEQLQNGTAQAISPREEAVGAFLEAVSEKAKSTLWASGCKSWYIASDGKVYIYPWPFTRFQAEMEKPEMEDFHVT